MNEDSPLAQAGSSDLPVVSWETILQVVGYCGYFDWETRWLLDRPAPDLGGGSGGFVVQRVDLRFVVNAAPNPGARLVGRYDVPPRLG